MLSVFKALFALFKPRVASFQFQIVSLFPLLFFKRKLFRVFFFDSLDALRGGFAAKELLAGKTFRLALRALFLHQGDAFLMLFLHLKALFLLFGFSQSLHLFFLRLLRGFHFRLFRLAFFPGERGVHALLSVCFFLLFHGLFDFSALVVFFRFLLDCALFSSRSRVCAACAFRFRLSAVLDIFYFFRPRRGVFRNVVFFLFHAFNSFLMVRLR